MIKVIEQRYTARFIICSRHNQILGNDNQPNLLRFDMSPANISFTMSVSYLNQTYAKKILQVLRHYFYILANLHPIDILYPGLYVLVYEDSFILKRIQNIIITKREITGVDCILSLYF